MGTERRLLVYLLNNWWSGLMINILIWGWVILVIPILCRSWWMILSIIHIFNISMVLTHSQGYIRSSSPAVLTLCRETASCTHVFVTILLGYTRSLSAALRASIHGSQYRHASCIQIVNCTPSWSTFYLCSILHGCFFVPLMLTSKLLVSKLGMWIR